MNIFRTTYSQTALFLLQQMAQLGFLPTTLWLRVIQALIELLQTGTFEGRSIDRATAPRQLWISNRVISVFFAKRVDEKIKRISLVYVSARVNLKNLSQYWFFSGRLIAIINGFVGKCFRRLAAENFPVRWIMLILSTVVKSKIRQIAPQPPKEEKNCSRVSAWCLKLLCKNPLPKTKVFLAILVAFRSKSFSLLLPNQHRGVTFTLGLSGGNHLVTATTFHWCLKPGWESNPGPIGHVVDMLPHKGQSHG